MKNIHKLFLIMITLFLGISFVNAECTNADKVELGKAASAIKVSYKEVEELLDPSTYIPAEGEENEDVYYNYFKVNFNNVSENLRIEVSNNQNNKTFIISSEMLFDGSYSFDWKDLTDPATISYTVKGNIDSECSGVTLKKGMISLPAYNYYYTHSKCVGLEDETICQKYVFTKITGKAFEKEYNKLTENEKTEQEELVKDKTIFERIYTYISENIYLTILVSIVIVVIIGIIVILIVKNKKNRIIVFILLLSLSASATVFQKTLGKPSEIDEGLIAVGEEATPSTEYTVNELESTQIQLQNGEMSSSIAKLEFVDPNTGEKVTGWCKDPYANADRSGTYTDVTSEIGSDVLSQYQSVFNQTCGDERMQAAAIRAVAGKNDEYTKATGKDSTEAKYNGLMNGTVSYGSSSTEAERFNDVLSGSEEYSSQNSGIKTSTINSSTKVVTSDSPIKSLDDSSYCTKSESGGTYTYTCKLEDDYCDPTMGSGDPVTIPMGDGNPDDYTDAGDGGICTPCQVKVFRSTSAQGMQEFVSCVDSNGNSRGTGGKSYDEYGNALTEDDYSDPTDSDYGDLGLECDPVDEYCDPYIDWDYDDMPNNAGSEVCDWNGDTIIYVDELYEEEFDNIDKCLFDDGKDIAKAHINATQWFFDSSIDSSKSNKGPEGKELCNVYCTEDYELILPGPTADKYDDQVMVNAGTFFTIDKADDIHNETRVKCYLKQNYTNLIYEIDYQRQRTANAYTNYEKGETARGGYKISDDGCSQYRECAEYDADGNYIGTSRRSECGCEITKWGYQFYVPYSEVTLTLTNDENSANYVKSVLDKTESGDCGTGTTKPDTCSSAESFISTNEKYDSEYMNGVSNDANSKITNIIKKWNTTCSTVWDFAKINSDIYSKEEFQTWIEFYYDDKSKFAGDVEVKFTGITPTDGPQEIKNDDSAPNEPKTGICNATKIDNTKTEEVSRYKYVKKEETVTAKYEMINYFCSPYDDEEEAYFCADKTCSGCDGQIIRGFPVSINTPQGVYSYRYDYGGIGHYFDSGSTGRLEGVIHAYYNYSNSDVYDNTCVYNVNSCKNCGVRCVNKDGAEGCSRPFVKCNNKCQVTCVGGGCIVDFKAGFLATYRTMSLNEPFPNTISLLPGADSMLALAPLDVSPTNNFNRRYGSNWNTPKGDAAKAAIEGAGEKIYESDPQYRIRLEPGEINQIKEYNKANPDYRKKIGMDCSNTSNEYAKCKSQFIRDYFTGSEDIFSDNWEAWPTIDEFVGPAYK